MNPLIHEIKHIEKHPNSQEARSLLNKCASSTFPIMRKYNLNVVCLSEFYPKQSNLLGLNVNRGFEIKIRLRQHYDVTSFLSWDSIILTMLHELTHNTFGPHDAKFYSLLDKLTTEFNSISQDGGWKHDLLGNGLKLGGVYHNNARQVALDAAQKRQKINSIMLPVGGKRLGSIGFNDEANYTIKELALMAAERRKLDDIQCGVGALDISDPDIQSSSSSSSKLNSKNAGVLDTQSNNSSSSSKSNSKNAGVLDIQSNNSSSSNSKIVQLPKQKQNSIIELKIPAQIPDWSCTYCTLLNNGISLVCNACFTLKPTSGWECDCGLHNQDKDFECTECKEQRIF